MAAMPASLEIRGIRLVNLAPDEAVAAVATALDVGARTRIAFVNADCVNLAARHPEYANYLAMADWVFIDGIGMRIAGALLEQPVRANVNGTDLFPLLCASLARSGHRLFLLGGQPGVARAAADWAETRHPGLRIAGTRDGFYRPEEEASVVAEIRACGADILLVGMGALRQEAWIFEHLDASGSTVAIGVGGLFDYYSGRIPRAPLWMRRLGLEWVFRLWQEPARMWRRYVIGNVVFLARIVGEWLARRRGRLAGVRTSQNFRKGEAS